MKDNYVKLITGFVTRLTRWVQLVEQELLTLLEHLSLPPVFNGGSCYSICSFMCMFCRSLFVSLSYPLVQEEFEDAKEVIRICISKKNRQHNGQRKSTKGQITIYKTYI
jgi:hypothetical protein